LLLFDYQEAFTTAIKLLREASTCTLRWLPALKCVTPLQFEGPTARLNSILSIMATGDVVNEAVAAWSKQYPLPDEVAEGSRAEVKQLYRCGILHENMLQQWIVKQP
jgi:hypothetical protein